MSGQIGLAVTCDRTESFRGTFTGAVELGRLDPTRTPPEALWSPTPTADGMRIAIAESGEGNVSRRQVRVTRHGADAVRIENLSGGVPVLCQERPPVPPRQAAEYPLPVTLQCGRFSVRIWDADAGEPTDAAKNLRTLEDATEFISPANVGLGGGFTREIAALPPATVAGLIRWWRNVIGVLQSASNSDQFFHRAVESLVKLVGLDLGAVFLHEHGEWRPAALASSQGPSTRASTGVLRRVLAERRTFWNRVDDGGDGAESMALIDAFVAAPILGPDGSVIGALYGHRTRRPGTSVAEISQLEAMLVETLACGVAAGLARLREQQAALARKVTLEQFFTPELAGQLEARPDLLEGRDVDVSVLFCDIRGFSRVAGRIGPQATLRWVHEVLNALSDEVAATGGVLVDYVGDELMAMWGAPADQPDHAALAAATARRMVAALPRLNGQWEAEIGTATAYGIGINSGTARVGNVGSTRKFKYGPLGNVVNLAARVRGATKYFRVDTLVTGAVRGRLDESFLTRRLCAVRMVNIEEPVELHELDAGGDPRRAELFGRYAEALAAYEQGRYSVAARELGDLLAAFPKDGPSLVLLTRAVDAMANEPAEPPLVWTLPGK